MRIETERQRRRIFALDPRLVCSPPQSIIIPRHAARDPSAKSPHFKFSFPDCAPQFESDMPPYSRAPCRYTSTHPPTLQGVPLIAEQERSRQACAQCRISSHETSPDYPCGATRFATVLFPFHGLHISPVLRPPFRPSVRPVGVECAKRETQ